jgi:hypothetical protein
MPSKVPFTQETGMKCVCKKCPVQADSKCAADQKKAVMEAMQKMPEGMVAPEEFPGLYCSTGTASCTDFDFTKMCICVSCPIWDEFNLESGKLMGYFCRDGAAI